MVGRCLPLDFAQLEEIQALLPKFLALPKGKILTARTHARTHSFSIPQRRELGRTLTVRWQGHARVLEGYARQNLAGAREPELPRARACAMALVRTRLWTGGRAAYGR